MRYQRIHAGVFQARPNRFIAHVELSGKTEICHVKNTGRCRELLVPGAAVYLEEAQNPARKTRFDLIAVQNNAYTKSGEDSYGGYVSQYGIYVMVGADSTKADKEKWILEDTIPAGEYRPVSGEPAAE